MHKARHNSLKQRHALLEAQLHYEKSRPYPDPQELQRLKKQKLMLRDQMMRMSSMPQAA